MTDPTLQTSGALQALLRLDWNGSQSVAFDSIAYGPANTPPPPWTTGNQYSVLSPTTGIIPFGAPAAGGLAGYAYLSVINDMSPATVRPNSTYALTFNITSNWVQLYFQLTGSAAGTTVLPGFGLWSLSTNPQAWTYVTPTEFTGLWEIELLTPSSDAPVLLSVEYAPPRNYGAPQEVAKLVFTVSGGQMTQGLWSESALSSSDAGSAAQAPGSGGPVRTQHLHRSSTPHVMRSKEGEVLPAIG